MQVTFQTTVVTDGDVKPMYFAGGEDPFFIGSNEVERLVEVSVEVHDNGDEFEVDTKGMTVQEVDLQLPTLDRTDFTRSQLADFESDACEEYRKILTAAMNRFSKRVAVGAV